MGRVWAIAVTDLRRMFRVPANIFFAFVFPMLLILVLGATFGGAATPRIGVVAPGTGPLEGQLVKQLKGTPHLRVVRMGDRNTMISQVARGRLDAGLVVPAGYDASIRAGHQVDLEYVGRLDQSSAQLNETVRGAVAKQAIVLGAARFAVAQHVAANFSAGLATAAAASSSVPVIAVTQTVAGEARLSATLGQFDQSAYTELLLFVFLTALSGSLALIETRRLGLSRRMLSTPTSATAVIAGETLGRLLIGATQAVVIILGSALLFGVEWGQPIGVAAVVALFAFVAAAAGIFLGTLFRNEQQAMGISIFAGMGLGALGGCMVPLELFSSTMKHVAHLTPHAWANDAFSKLVGHGASITNLGTQLGVLAAFATGLLLLSTWRLRHVLLA